MIEKTEAHSISSTIVTWALLFFIIGGVGGWYLGRQSVTVPELIASESATINQEAIAAQGERATLLPSPTIVSDGENAGISTPTNAPPTNPPANTDNPALPTPASLSPETFTTMGDPNAPVTIVEFSDYECPFCLRHHQQVFPILKEKYIDTGRVFYVFKDFPIASLHPVAARVHEVALCVGELGGNDAFWQAHDIFFESQQQWSDQPQPQLDDITVGLVADVGVPEADIRACLDEGNNATQVQQDLQEGQRLGVNGTPAFFVNGFPLSGARPIEQFELAIQLAEEGTLAEAFAPRTGPNDGKAQATANAPVSDIPIGDAPLKGDPNAPVTIIEYSDYQCPFCLRYFQTTMPFIQEYIDAGQVNYYFKEFPLTSIHPQAPKAHETARCAQELGGDDASYWEMHDQLFIEQARWGQAAMGQHIEVLKAMAGEMGYEAEAFADCLDSGRYAGIVASDMAEGRSLGIGGTPTFFVNGQRLVGAQPLNVFQQTIESLLAREE
jgi:protein-disulfide isomerase